MTMTTANCPATRRPAVSPRFSVFAALASAYALWHQRQVLKSLDAAALNDIGVTRAEAETEAGRPIWDAPENWHR